jgi:hypothetical protein
MLAITVAPHSIPLTIHAILFLVCQGSNAPHLEPLPLGNRAVHLSDRGDMGPSSNAGAVTCSLGDLSSR